MPINLNKEDANYGEIIYQWTVKEYEKYNRGKRWYVSMGVVAILLVLFAFFTANYLFALLIILFGMILLMSDMREPMDIPFAITNTGIIIGDKYYRYSELSNFWIVYSPPAVKNLYFTFSSVLRHRIQIPLMNYDPRPIRDYLIQFLEEDLEQEEEPLSDKISRLFLLH